MLGVLWQPYYSVTLDYIEELTFAGLQMGDINAEFRAKYGPYLENNSGDENLCFARISDEVGWGVFALRDIKVGQIVCRYAGEFVREDRRRDRSYCVACKLDNCLLDAKFQRNFGGLINHSSCPNAEIRSIFEKVNFTFALRPY